MAVDRIRLRLPEPNDHPLLAAWCNDPTLTPYFYSDEPVSLESHLRWYAKVATDPTQRFFVIEALVAPAEPYDGVVRLQADIIFDSIIPCAIGCVGLNHIEPLHRRAEYGWLKIGDVRYRSGGFGREAENAMMRFGFEQLNLNRIYCEVLSDNRKVIEMHERTGYKVEGMLRNHVWKRGEFRDIVVMGLLKEDFYRQEAGVEEIEYAHNGTANS